MSQMGVVPQSIPGGEIYQALEKGTIDAVEWVGPYDDQKLGFYKVAKNYYFPAWWEGGPQLSLYVNSKAYASLTPDYKAMVDVASAYAHVEMQARYDHRNPRALKEMVAGGAKLHRMPKPIMDEAFKITQQLYADLSNKNPRWKKVYSDYASYLREQNQWHRLAEKAFDDFMQAQKL